MVSYTTDFGNSQGNGIRFGCEKGTVLMDNIRTQPSFSARGGPKRDGGIRGENTIESVSVPDHQLDWLRCLRSGKQPVAPIEAGYQHSVACIMAMTSFDSGQRMIYDPNKREVRAG